MTVSELEGRGTVSVAEAAALLGCTTGTLYRAIREDDSPVAFIRHGRKVVVVAADLRRVLMVTQAA